MFTMLIPGNLPVERMPRNVPSNMQGHLHGPVCARAREEKRGRGERVSSSNVGRSSFSMESVL